MEGSVPTSVCRCFSNARDPKRKIEYGDRRRLCKCIIDDQNVHTSEVILLRHAPLK
jgi:hypothetical protein